MTDPSALWVAYGPSGFGALLSDLQVKLVNVEDDAELNGTIATVKGWDGRSTSFEVEVPHREEGLRMKAENLIPSHHVTYADAIAAAAGLASPQRELLQRAPLMTGIGKCLSAGDVAALSVSSRLLRAVLCSSSEALLMWEDFLQRQHGAGALQVAQLVTPAAAGREGFCRSMALRQVFDNSLEIVGGNIVDKVQGVEVCVCPTLASLELGGPGAARAIRTAGGPVLETAIQSLSRDEVKPLTVHLLPGGDLGVKVALTITQPPRPFYLISPEEKRIETILGFLTYLHGNLLAKVREEGCRSVVLPTLCTTGIGLPLYLVALGAVRAIRRDFWKNPTDPIKVRIACFEASHEQMLNTVKEFVLKGFYNPEETDQFIRDTLSPKRAAAQQPPQPQPEIDEDEDLAHQIEQA